MRLKVQTGQRCFRIWVNFNWQRYAWCQLATGSVVYLVHQTKPTYSHADIHTQVLYNAMLENNCSENASRMSAMENSTKNASEMLNKLALTYNRYVTTAPQVHNETTTPNQHTHNPFSRTQWPPSFHYDRAHRDYLGRSSPGRLSLRAPPVAFCVLFFSCDGNRMMHMLH